VDLYFEKEQPRVYDKFGDRWEFVVTTSEGQFQQVSFVNSINTIKGGTHVTHVTDQFVESILDKVNKKNRGGMEIKPFHVRSHLWVFVNCLIVNPTFDSQTKETMTLKQSKFGSKCEVPEKAIKQLFNMGIVDTVLQWAKARESIDMKKKMKGTGRASRLLGIPKLEDANWAGTRNSEECTLILTEGDSAKALAVAGLSIVGRDRFGVFPLRGKPLNVRDANFQQTVNNAEIQNIIQILGLEQQKVYDSVKSLRYGSVMIMADQDYDGSHIKGLLLNMFQHWWPSLFKLEGFVKEFITPIVKVSKGSQELQFFSVVDYEAWKEKSNGGKGWTTKYYKGLGTSTAKEGKEYFKNIRDHRMFFKWTGARDDELIDLAFNKKRADDRKEWINCYKDGDAVDHSRDSVTYADFVNKELVCFSRYDVMRSIPCFVDGMKPGQRKILFATFKRNLRSDVKVAQLAGYVAEHSAYHHGEASLQGTIVGMAQNFVGSNNINLLVPSGQFGTRLQGGKDHASARYIYTRLEPITRTIFHPDDDPLLEFQAEEGQSIEPRWYIPVIPMALVNGAEGIGTGWSTSLPNFNPRDIIAMLRKLIKKQSPGSALQPWYRGFKGSIVPNQDKSGFEVAGIAKKVANNQIDITELPVKKWTQDYKEFLGKMAEAEGDSARGKIDDIKEFHTENTVHFSIHGTVDQIKALEHEGLEKALNLRGKLATTNIVFFDADGKIKKFASVQEMLDEFFKLRMRYYVKRKEYHVDRLQKEKNLIDAKVRFILMVIKGEIVVSKRKRDELIAELKSKGFKPYNDIVGKGRAEAEEEEPKPTGKEAKEPKSGFDYLLGMPLWSLTYERVEDLRKQAKEKTQELTDLQNTTPETLWERDLDAIVAELNRMDEEEEEMRKEEGRLRAGKRSRPKAKASAGRKSKGGKKDGGQDENEPMEVDDDEDEVEAVPAKKPKGEETSSSLLDRLKEKRKHRASLVVLDSVDLNAEVL